MIQKQGNKFYYLVPNFGMSLVKHVHTCLKMYLRQKVLVEGSHYDMIYCTSLHRRMLYDSHPGSRSTHRSSIYLPVHSTPYHAPHRQQQAPCRNYLGQGTMQEFRRCSPYNHCKSLHIYLGMRRTPYYPGGCYNDWSADIYCYSDRQSVQI